MGIAFAGFLFFSGERKNKDLKQQDAVIILKFNILRNELTFSADANEFTPESKILFPKTLQLMHFKFEKRRYNI